MRVLHIVSGMGIGGIETFLFSLYEKIDKNKVQCDFVIHKKSSEGFESKIREMGGKIYYFPEFQIYNVVLYTQYIKRFLKEHTEYKIIHIHFRKVSAIWTLAAKAEQRVSVVHSHNTTNGYDAKAFIIDILQYPVRYFADYCMGCSQQANEWMFGKKRANSNTCFVIKNGIDTKKFSYNLIVRERVRKQFDFSETDIIIGTVGRLVEQKNQALIISAFAEAIKDRTDLRLMIVGDGPLDNHLNQLADDMKISDYTTFTGARNDVNEILQAFDIFVLASKNEGLGIAIIEAQAADLPVVISPAVPDEACITENIIHMDSFDKNQWKQAFLSTEVRKRKKREPDIAEAGYDIQTSSNWLQEFYTQLFVGDSK